MTFYYRGRGLVKGPLARRREVLAETWQRLDVAETLFSEPVLGHGTALYATWLARGHEGLVAEHLASIYRLGRRGAVWQKIKPPPRRTSQPDLPGLRILHVHQFGIHSARSFLVPHHGANRVGFGASKLAAESLDILRPLWPDAHGRQCPAQHSFPPSREVAIATS